MFMLTYNYKRENIAEIVSQGLLHKRIITHLVIGMSIYDVNTTNFNVDMQMN